MNYNKTSFIISVLMFFTFICEAQKDSISVKKTISKNVVYVEALGNGSYLWYSGIPGSFNYERVVKVSAKTIFALRAGVGIGLDNNINTETLLFTFIRNPSGKHHFESAIGVALRNGDNILNHTFGLTGSLKYRYQKPEPGVYFSVGWTPKFYYLPRTHHGPDPNADDIIPGNFFRFFSLGLSLGITF